MVAGQRWGRSRPVLWDRRGAILGSWFAETACLLGHPSLPNVSNCPRGRGPSGGLKCSKPVLAEMVDAKGMAWSDVGGCRSPRRRREVGSATVPFVVVVDHMVELKGLKPTFSSPGFTF